MWRIKKKIRLNYYTYKLKKSEAIMLDIDQVIDVFQILMEIV